MTVSKAGFFLYETEPVAFLKAEKLLITWATMNFPRMILKDGISHLV